MKKRVLSPLFSCHRYMEGKDLLKENIDTIYLYKGLQYYYVVLNMFKYLFRPYRCCKERLVVIGTGNNRAL